MSEKKIARLLASPLDESTMVGACAVTHAA